MPDNVLEIKLTGTGSGGSSAAGGGSNSHPNGSAGGGSKQHTPGGPQPPTSQWPDMFGSATAKAAAAAEKTRAANEAKAIREKERREREAARRVSDQRGRVLTAGFGAQAIMSSNGSAGGAASGAVQMAGSGLFGARAAALAGGPVGAAAMIAGIALDMKSQHNERTAERIEWAGRATGAAANSVFRGDAFGGARDFIASARDQGIKAVEGIPFVGKYLASEIKVALAPLNAGAAFLEAAYGGAQARAAELAPFSGQITAAQARSDVRQTMFDMKEAGLLGDKYSELTDLTSEFKTTMNELFLPVKDVVLTVLVDLARDGKNIAEGAKEFLSLVPAFRKYFGGKENEPLPAFRGLFKSLEEQQERLIAQKQTWRVGEKQPIPAAPVAGAKINTVGKLL